jgi:hypothetical protein
VELVKAWRVRQQSASASPRNDGGSSPTPYSAILAISPALASEVRCLLPSFRLCAFRPFDSSPLPGEYTKRSCRGSRHGDGFRPRGVPIDLMANAFMDHWIRGHGSWSFESGRCFGSEGSEISKHRPVALLLSVNQRGVTLLMVLSIAQSNTSTYLNPTTVSRFMMLLSFGWRSLFRFYLMLY